MPRCAFRNSALAGLLLFGGQFLAQAQTISINTPGISVTTGIVGVTSTQTARLNVLNLHSRRGRRRVPGDAGVLR